MKETLLANEEYYQKFTISVLMAEQWNVSSVFTEIKKTRMADFKSSI